MQAVILAAGKSSRFYPFNTLTHKSCLSLLGKLLIEHTLAAVKKSGIYEIVIIVSPHSQIPELLGNGVRFGLQIEYITQEEPLGMGHGLLAASEKLQDEFFVLHAHRVDFCDYKEEMENKKALGGIVLLAKEEQQWGKYGVLKIEGDRALSLNEKPKQEDTDSPFRIMGIYLLDKSFISVLKDTPAEHYSFETALDRFIKQHESRVVITKNESFSLKYAWDILKLKNR